MYALVICKVCDFFFVYRKEQAVVVLVIFDVGCGAVYLYCDRSVGAVAGYHSVAVGVGVYVVH